MFSVLWKTIKLNSNMIIKLMQNNMQTYSVLTEQILVLIFLRKHIRFAEL